MAQMPQNIIDRAESIRAALSSTVDATRNNTDLTVEARQRQIVAAYAAAEKQMKALEDTWDSGSQTNEKTLMREVFGRVANNGQEAISARDADDRAAQLETPADALDLLGRADRNGDASLSRAIALRAYTEFTVRGFWGDSDWGNVLVAYVQDRPTDAPKIDALITSYRSSPADSASTMFTFAVPKPNEVAAAGYSAVLAAQMDAS